MRLVGLIKEALMTDILEEKKKYIYIYVSN
jgi:hypothetical protein